MNFLNSATAQMCPESVQSQHPQGAQNSPLFTYFPLIHRHEIIIQNNSGSLPQNDEAFVVTD